MIGLLLGQLCFVTCSSFAIVLRHDCEGHVRYGLEGHGEQEASAQEHTVWGSVAGEWISDALFEYVILVSLLFFFLIVRCLLVQCALIPLL